MAFITHRVFMGPFVSCVETEQTDKTESLSLENLHVGETMTQPIPA